MSTEILPCPVCGKPCRWAAALVGVKFFILCAVDCPYGGTSGDTEAAAIAAHNTVAAAARDLAAVVAERDALREALDNIRALTAQKRHRIPFAEVQAILRLCADAGMVGNPLRATAPKEAPDA